MATTLPFSIVNAFTDSLYGGNPAAIVFLTGHERLLSESDVLQGIAKNFNQPITTFVAKLDSTEGDELHTAKFTIRWFIPSKEVALCGHGALAAASVILSTPGLAPEDTKVLEFHSTTRVVRASQEPDGFWGIRFPSTLVEELSPEEQAMHREIVRKALGDANLEIPYVGVGGPGLGNWMMIEIDEKFPFAGHKVDTDALRACKYHPVVITARSLDPSVKFVSRMFAPNLGLPEDHVCGTAHCLMAPYWATKLGHGTSEVNVDQVSERGGRLKVTWDKEGGHVLLKGQTRLFCEGKIQV